mmetsp:Transcript_9098/g.13418  ORF Transcript_9098/g.13418 Transcript_9098/m.13418 type:complete len:235 (+) Transcript_9098:100-804(+)
MAPAARTGLLHHLDVSACVLLENVVQACNPVGDSDLVVRLRVELRVLGNQRQTPLRHDGLRLRRREQSVEFVDVDVCDVLDSHAALGVFDNRPGCVAPIQGAVLVVVRVEEQRLLLDFWLRFGPESLERYPSIHHLQDIFDVLRHSDLAHFQRPFFYPNGSSSSSTRACGQVISFFGRRRQRGRGAGRRRAVRQDKTDFRQRCGDLLHQGVHRVRPVVSFEVEAKPVCRDDRQH